MAVTTIVLAVYYGLRKMLTTWDWYIERFTDSKACQFLKDHPGEFINSEHFGESYYKTQYWSPEALAVAMQFGKRRIARSLERLKRQRRVKLMREGCNR